MRPCGLAERRHARAGLGVRQLDGVAADVASSVVEHFAATASGEREQPDRGDGLGPFGLAGFVLPSDAEAWDGLTVEQTYDRLPERWPAHQPLQRPGRGFSALTPTAPARS